MQPLEALTVPLQLTDLHTTAVRFRCLLCLLSQLKEGLKLVAGGERKDSAGGKGTYT